VTSNTAERGARPAGPVGRAPFALLAVILIPALAGALRLVELAGGPRLLPADPRLTASPLPLVVHIVSTLLLAPVGAFQLSAGLRRRRPAWHRVAGRVVVGAGLAAALSALWLTLLLPRQPGTGELAHLGRLAVGSGLAVSLILGVVAIRRRDVPGHRAWMIRAYALALGAGTQAFTQGIALAVAGPGVLTRDVALAAGWAVNLAIAELVIRRAPARPVPLPAPVAGRADAS
jgi:uncharacterized membrane protein